jgi:hypothetical protein
MNRKELNWNKEFSTINIYPPLNPVILITFVLSGKIVASRILSMHNLIGKGVKRHFINFQIIKMNIFN